MIMSNPPKKTLNRRTDRVYRINPVAMELKDPKFRKQVIPDKKKDVNTRRNKNRGKDFLC